MYVYVRTQSFCSSFYSYLDLRMILDSLSVLRFEGAWNVFQDRYSTSTRERKTWL